MTFLGSGSGMCLGSDSYYDQPPLCRETGSKRFTKQVRKGSNRFNRFEPNRKPRTGKPQQVRTGLTTTGSTRFGGGRASTNVGSVSIGFGRILFDILDTSALVVFHLVQNQASKTVAELRGCGSLLDFSLTSPGSVKIKFSNVFVALFLALLLALFLALPVCAKKMPLLLKKVGKK